jgi:uncharacterized protein
VFTAATGLAILHILDDAFIGKQPGTTADDHLFAAGVLLVILGGSLALYPRVRAGARGALAVGLGILITTAGAMHVVHAVVDEAEQSDFTGMLAIIGGVALIALGLFVAWRGPRPASWMRRWTRRGLVAIGALLTAFYVLLPIGVAIFVTHTPREPIDGTFAVPHEDVVLETADRLTLRGWYAPSRNGAAVVLVHGSGGSRLGPRKHARLLAEHGYGVLLYDGRGRGESEGDPLGFTWTWQPDVDAAVDYLKARPDVNEGRIGALGLSGGAEALIESAARREDLRAVVAEGAGTRAYGEQMGHLAEHHGDVRRGAGPFGLAGGSVGRRLRRRRPPRPSAPDRRRQGRRCGGTAEPDLGGAGARARSALGATGGQAHPRARRGT